MRRVLVSAGLVAGILLPAGCSATSTAPESSPSVDCAVVRMAMEDYSSALTDLAASLEAGDAMSAVGAADTMTFALDQLEAALPGIPAPGDGFLASSRAVALEVKQAAADSPAMTGLVEEITTTFSDPAFAEGGDAIDAYADQMCPEPSPSAS